jgi:RNA polymerase sigma-70 factor (ECF subfamily)
LQKKNRSELIRAALKKLSPEDRDILTLVYFHENSVEDCALHLNLPVAKVKTRMLSARKKLAELVEEA